MSFDCSLLTCFKFECPCMLCLKMGILWHYIKSKFGFKVNLAVFVLCSVLVSSLC